MKMVRCRHTLNELNTGIPSYTLTNVWFAGFRITGWGFIVLVPIVSLSQKLIITKADIFANNAWKPLTIRDVTRSGPSFVANFDYAGTLTDGVYIFRITGKLEK